MKVDRILGREVITEDAMHLGTVESVAIDLSDWSTPVLKVCLEKGMDSLLGIKKPMFSSACVYMRTQIIDSVSDMVTINTPMGSLKENLLPIGDSEILTAGQLIGKKVISKGAREMGVLSSLIIDEGVWKVTFIEIKLTKQAIEDMGLKSSVSSGRLFRLKTVDVKTVGDMVLLAIDADMVKDHIEGMRDTE